MNLGINPNYQQPMFNAKIITTKNTADITKVVGVAATAVGAGAIVDNIANFSESMSAEELTGRTQVTSNPIHQEPEIFNKEVSLNYFANGKLKDFPEYAERAKLIIEHLDSYDKKNKLNTLKFQEQLVDKILSEDVLKNNECIRKNLYYIVNYDYDIFVPDTEEEIQNMMHKYEERSKAQIKLLDAYSKNPKMQQNEYINKYLCDFIRDIAGYEKNINDVANTVIEILKNNTDNNDEKFFKSLDGYMGVRTVSVLLKKLLSDKRLYNSYTKSFLYNIAAYSPYETDKIMQMIDNDLARMAETGTINKKFGDIHL